MQDQISDYAVQHQEEGRIRGVDTWFSDGRHISESYTYDGERLTHIARDNGSRFRVQYDEDGALAVIWSSVPEHNDGQEYVAYRRKSPGDVVRARREAEQLLYEGVRAWARRQEITGTARVLIIGYGYPPDDVLPPPLGLGQTDDTVIAQVAGGADTSSMYSVAYQGIFDPEPAEFAGEVSAFQKLNQEWRSTSDSEAGRRLLLAVAKRLNQEDWAAVFPAIAKDFVVVPVDAELTDLKPNLRAAQAR